MLSNSSLFISSVHLRRQKHRDFFTKETLFRFVSESINALNFNPSNPINLLDFYLKLSPSLQQKHLATFFKYILSRNQNLVRLQNDSFLFNIFPFFHLFIHPYPFFCFLRQSYFERYQIARNCLIERCYDSILLYYFRT